MHFEPNGPPKKLGLKFKNKMVLELTFYFIFSPISSYYRLFKIFFMKKILEKRKFI